MANKILVARGTKARLEEIKSTLAANELVYATDTGELGVKKADGNIEYFKNATDIDVILANYVDKDEIDYLNHAAKIFYDSKKGDKFKSAWEDMKEVDPAGIAQTSGGIAQYPNGEVNGVIIPNSVTSIGNNAFSEWTANNQPLVIPNSVTSIGTSAFANWKSNNQQLVIPNSVVTISGSVFIRWEANNQQLVIPNSVTSIGNYAFAGWQANNQQLVIPNSVTSIGNYAFTGWQANNQPLVIGNSVTSIGNQGFGGWTSNNQPLVIPNSVVTIGEYAFAGWQANNHPLVIPDSVTNIGNSVFSSWTSNNQPLVIPNSVTSIGEYAFAGWQAVPYIIMERETPPTLESSTAFDDQNNTPIYVPDGSLNAYKTATNWSALASRIFAISDRPDEVDDKIIAHNTDSEAHQDIRGDIGDLVTALAGKVDKVEGKGLSVNDLTNTLKSNYDTAYSWGDHAIEGYLKEITKAMVEAVLTGTITTHNHSGTYEPANGNIQPHIASTSNPHGVTKEQVGLGNVDNTSDETKYVQGLRETRANVNTKIWTGTQAQYDAIVTKDATTLYFITE